MRDRVSRHWRRVLFVRRSASLMAYQSAGSYAGALAEIGVGKVAMAGIQSDTMALSFGVRA